MQKRRLILHFIYLTILFYSCTQSDKVNENTNSIKKTIINEELEYIEKHKDIMKVRYDELKELLDKL